MFKFREPTFVEYLLYDVERFREKDRREQVIICLQFLEGTPPLESFKMSEADKLVNQFNQFLAGGDKVIPLRG